MVRHPVRVLQLLLAELVLLLLVLVQELLLMQVQRDLASVQRGAVDRRAERQRRQVLLVQLLLHLLLVEMVQLLDVLLLLELLLRVQVLLHLLLALELLQLLLLDLQLRGVLLLLLEQRLLLLLDRVRLLLLDGLRRGQGRVRWMLDGRVARGVRSVRQGGGRPSGRGEHVGLRCLAAVLHLLDHFFGHAGALGHACPALLLPRQVHADLLRPADEFKPAIDALVARVGALRVAAGAAGQHDRMMLFHVTWRQGWRVHIVIIVQTRIPDGFLRRTHSFFEFLSDFFRTILTTRQTCSVLAFAGQMYANLLRTPDEGEVAEHAAIFRVRALGGGGRASM